MIETSAGVQLTSPDAPYTDEILTPEALGFAAQLHRSFNPERIRLLQDRVLGPILRQAAALSGYCGEL